MLVYIIKRLLLLPLLLFIFSVVAFILIQAPPGDFVTSYVAELAASGSSMDRVQIEALRNLYGLDQPMYVQYLKWVARILQGDLGVSLDWRKPISELIGQRLLLTLALGLFTLLFDLGLAPQLALFALYSVLAVMVGKRWYGELPQIDENLRLNEPGRRMIGKAVTVVATTPGSRDKSPISGNKLRLARGRRALMSRG